jgi:hypothetical protein
MFELIGVFAVLAVLIPIAVVCAVVCLVGTLLKGAGWLALGVVKFVLGGIFLVGMLLLGLFALPFALIFG